jgi:protein-tyrosine phosphatase
MISVLFVCLGNICRSPAGEGILKRLIDEDEENLDIQVASCGIGGWHVGQLPDSRMRKAATERGIVLASRAQQLKPEFFEQFDYLLAADNEVLRELYHIAATTEHKAKVHLVTKFSKSYYNQDVPDPYYGGSADFDLVLDMLQDACKGLIEDIKKR